MVFNFRGVGPHCRSSSVEVKPPMAKFIKEAAEEHWSSQVARLNPPTALKILSPTSTGTEESGTAAPKTPNCDMENACRPCVTIPACSAEQGSTFSADSGRLRVPDMAAHEDGSSARHQEEMIRKLPKKEHLNGEVYYMWSADSGTSYGRKRLKRIPSRIALPLIRSEPVEQTPTSRSRDVSTQTLFSDERKLRPKEGVLDEETEAVVQAATSLLSLSSDEGIRRPLSREPESPLEGEREVDDELGLPSSTTSSGGACSVLSRPCNKRRYRLVVDLLAVSPRVR